MAAIHEHTSDKSCSSDVSTSFSTSSASENDWLPCPTEIVDCSNNMETDDTLKSSDAPKGHHIQIKSAGLLTVEKFQETFMDGKAEVATTRGADYSPYNKRKRPQKTAGTEERITKSPVYNNPQKKLPVKQPEESRPQPVKQPEEANSERTTKMVTRESVVRVTKSPDHHSPTRQRKVQPREPEERKPHSLKEPEEAAGQAGKKPGPSSKPSAGQASKPSGQKKQSGPEQAGVISRPPPPVRTVSPIGSPCPPRNMPVHPYWSGKY